jgi:hypothetical protein
MEVLYMLENIYEKGDISPRISNLVLEQIMSTDQINGSQAKVFAYCYLGVASYLFINNYASIEDLLEFKYKY